MDLPSAIGDARMTVKFDINEPVEIQDFIDGLEGLSNEYQLNLKQQGYKVDADEISLVITSVKNGSIETELAPIAAAIIPTIAVMDNYLILTQFVKHIDAYMKYFLGKTVDMIPPTIKSAENFEKLLAPVSRKTKGAIRLRVRSGNSEMEYDYLDPDCVKAGIEIRKYIDNANATDEHITKNALLYFHQLSKKSKIEAAKTPDRGVIEELNRHHLPVFFASEMDEARVKQLGENPFKYSFYVDVITQTKRGKAMSYKVIKIHKITKDEPDM
ncbi:MAG: hypothetical protein P1V20_31455, partial [Verrucomicrobiales bacterium]|nr:hypothetical protein [Verrucomicrobiales bacterium]